VRTERGVYEAERLVLAAGAYAPAMLETLGLPLTVKRNVLYWLMPSYGRELFRPERCPICIWEGAGHASFYSFPELPGSPQGVKAAFHNFGPLTTPERIDRSVHPDEVADMRAWLRERMPTIAGGELLATATCMYTLTPDMHFLIDRHPEHPQVLICSPCSGHGFKMATAVGEIMADLAQHGATAHPIGPFGVGRLRG